MLVAELSIMISFEINEKLWITVSYYGWGEYFDPIYIKESKYQPVFG